MLPLKHMELCWSKPLPFLFGWIFRFVVLLDDESSPLSAFLPGLPFIKLNFLSFAKEKPPRSIILPLPCFTICFTINNLSFGLIALELCPLRKNFLCPSFKKLFNFSALLRCIDFLSCEFRSGANFVLFYNNQDLFVGCVCVNTFSAWESKQSIWQLCVSVHILVGNDFCGEMGKALTLG